MNKLEVKYAQIVSEEYNNSFDEGGHTLLDTQKIAKQSTEITTDVAIKFALFLKNNCFVDIDTNDKTFWNHNGISYYEPQELFEIFINNHYGK